MPPPDRPTAPTVDAHRWLRLVAVLVTGALVASACVNQGFDEDPVLSSQSVDDLDAAPDQQESTTGEAAGSDPDDGGPDDLPAGAVSDPAALARIATTPCAFDEPVPLPRTPTCYEVAVPENWDDPDPDDQVVLQVAVFEADGGAADESATIYLDGGPGVSTLDLLWTSYGPLHRPQVGPRDYILFDQRGVGTSEPLLSCPELTELEVARLGGQLAEGTEGPATLDAVAACRTRLEASGADLDAYNSVASANDVEAIRSLLGYDQLNLLGVSYGTRLAQTHLRLYPQSVRSVVLDSIVPVEADLWTNLASEAQGAFEQLFAGCAVDPACSSTYPDLENRFFALLDRLDAEPVRLEFSDLLGGDDFAAVVDGDELLGLVFSALYDRSVFALMPSMVAEAEAGEYATIELLGSVEVTNFPYAALGQRLSVECNEEIAFEDEAQLAASAPTEPGYDRLGALDGDTSLFDLCREWPAGAAPVEESQPVVSEVPALLLAGSYDPITRPDNVDIVAANLANSFAFELPHEGHGIVSTDCGSELVAAFLDDPTVSPDGSCVAGGPAPVWVAGGDDGGDLELVAFEADEPFVVSGVRPAEWIDAGAGVFARQQTAADPTSLIVQPTGGIVASFVVELLATQLEVEFTEVDPIEAGGAQWQTFEADGDPEQVVRLAASSGPDGVLVVLVATADEVDRLYDQVFLPALQSARAG